MKKDLLEILNKAKVHEEDVDNILKLLITEKMQEEFINEVYTNYVKVGSSNIAELYAIAWKINNKAIEKMKIKTKKIKK